MSGGSWSRDAGGANIPHADDEEALVTPLDDSAEDEAPRGPALLVLLPVELLADEPLPLSVPLILLLLLILLLMICTRTRSRGATWTGHRMSACATVVRVTSGAP